MTCGAIRLPAAMAPAVDQTIGRGWFPLLARLHSQLSTVTTDFAYADIRREAGTLRCHVVYGDTVDSFTRGVCERLVDANVDESSTICEFCGRRGQVRQSPAGIWGVCGLCSEP
ncbi:UNVERIFIED_ORG: hypothetical protein L601_000200001560 [Gordonia westfalica J30]